MYDNGKWKIVLKRNGRIINLAFTNLILNDAINFNFNYSVNNATDSIVTHMFLGSTHGTIKPTDTAMSSVPIAAVPYSDYIKPNYDNVEANIYEHTLVFTYNPTETHTIKQIATGRINAGINRYFSVANLVDENGERVGLEVKPGDVLTFTYVLTMVGNLIDSSVGSMYERSLLTKASLNNLLKANPNWGLAGLQRQINVMAPIVSEFLGVPVTGSFSFRTDYGYASPETGEVYTTSLYEIRWTTVSGNPFTGVDGEKFKTRFYPSMIYPWSYTETNTVTPPTGNAWYYDWNAWLANGFGVIERFDHTKVKAILDPKTPDSFNYTLKKDRYIYEQDAGLFAQWNISLAGAEPLAQVLVVQNNRLVLPNPRKLMFVNKNGTLNMDIKITELKENMPFFIHFYNRKGMLKYGPLFVSSNEAKLQGSIEQPVYDKGNDVSTFYYPSSSYYSGYIYFKAFGKLTNDLGNKTIFARVMSDNNLTDVPADYEELSNRYAANTNSLYSISVGNMMSTLQLPNPRIRIKLTANATEFYDIPIVLKQIDKTVIPAVSRVKPLPDVLTAEFNFKKI